MKAPQASARQGHDSVMSMRNFVTSLLHDSSLGRFGENLEWQVHTVLKKLSEAPLELGSDTFQTI